MSDKPETESVTAGEVTETINTEAVRTTDSREDMEEGSLHALPNKVAEVKTETKEQIKTETKEFAITAREARWQRRLLPFMMSMLMALALFFLIASVIQVNTVQKNVLQAPTIDLKQALPTGGQSDASLEATRWKTLSVLEAYALQHRYHQANALLLTRVWAKNLGIITGMVLALIGAAFILGKLRDPETDLSGEGGGVKGTLKTASPGVIVVVLGAVLMIVTLTVQPKIDVEDSAIYVSSWQTDLASKSGESSDASKSKKTPDPKEPPASLKQAIPINDGTASKDNPGSIARDAIKKMSIKKGEQ